VLGLLGLGALGIATGSRVQNAIANKIAPLEERDPTRLLSLFPLGDTFRFYSVTQGAPTRTAATYQLAVTGLVDRPATYRLADLLSMPQIAFRRDFQCVTGWRVPEVPWRGVPLSHLLDLAGPTSSATAIRFRSFDGTYTESLTLEQARLPDVIVATGMLGGSVSRDHGGPVRLYVAPMYGYKSVKWLSGIELTADVIPGYWEHRGYDIDGFVGKSNGRSDAPT
jgi:DMSO/TMAO reductase YedYZ molybdopterin-dependent catalytic subunit